MDSCTHRTDLTLGPVHASAGVRKIDDENFARAVDVARTCRQIIETHDIHSVIMAISLIASQHRLSHTQTAYANE